MEEDHQLLSQLLGSFDIELAKLTEDQLEETDVYVELDGDLELDSDLDVSLDDKCAVVTDIISTDDPSSPSKKPRTLLSQETAAFTSRPIPADLSLVVCGAPKPVCVLAFYQELLLLVWHSHRCKRQLGDCLLAPESCESLHRLLRHALACSNDNCPLANVGCLLLRDVMHHYKQCKCPSCAVCAPVRTAVANVAAVSRRAGGSAEGISLTQKTDVHPPC